MTSMADSLPPCPLLQHYQTHGRKSLTHVLILGAAGMIGRKLTHRLCENGTIRGQEISKLTLVDIVLPEKPIHSAFSILTKACDFSQEGEAERLIEDEPELIFHLAAVVSGEAEDDFDKGYRINLDGTLRLFSAIKSKGEAYCPRVIFTSSIAVFGAPFPASISDDFHSTPLTSYGTQKAIGELLLADLTRRGMMDGIGIRLPTIVVRPGKPNKAASGFFSGIIREPLNNEEAILPVGDDVMHWMASPRSSIGFLIHAAEIDGNIIGTRRNLTMPGLAVTVAEQIDALRRIGGEKRANLVRRERDATIEHIVSGWPRRFDASRATSLGFKAERTFDDIVYAYIEDEGVAL